MAAYPDEYHADNGSGRWKYLEKLGEGGLAIVYRALDMTGPLGEVAIKVLRTNARPVHAFELHREAQWSLTRLHRVEDSRYDAQAASLFAHYLEDHSGFEGFHGGSDAPGIFETRRQHYESPDFNWEALGVRPASRPYVVIELLKGESLHSAQFVTNASAAPQPRECSALLQRLKPASFGDYLAAPRTPLTRADCHAIMLQLVRAVEYLASFDLIHRDLRACNVQLCQRLPSIEVKVLDLGVTIAAEESVRSSISPAIRVFSSKQAAKGYAWLPWEVRRDGETANFELPVHSFDTFSLAVLGCELLAGRVAARATLQRLAEGEAWADAVASLPALNGPSLAMFGKMLGPTSSRPVAQELKQWLAGIEGFKAPRVEARSATHKRVHALATSPSAKNGDSKSSASKSHCEEPSARLFVTPSLGTTPAKSDLSAPSQSKRPRISQNPLNGPITQKPAACASSEKLRLIETKSKTQTISPGDTSKAAAQSEMTALPVGPKAEVDAPGKRKQAGTKTHKPLECPTKAASSQALQHGTRAQPGASELYLTKVDLDRAETNLLHILGQLHEDKSIPGGSDLLSRVLSLLSEVQQCRSRASACQNCDGGSKSQEIRRSEPCATKHASLCRTTKLTRVS